MHLIQISFYILSICATNVITARVFTRLGYVEGGEYQTISGRKIYSFLGIPYAQPPIGRNRFEEPKSPNKWSGVWPAKTQRANCAQLNTFYVENVQILGDENCLYLNVYTPNVSITTKLPVLVYIHGGGFMEGSNENIMPDYLLDYIDFVYVSISYRLGPFGFLSTQDEVVPGNNGLKDQVLALEWVQNNIAYFGGNRKAVTISGNSAGGASVQYHFLSPLSRGLFLRGISSSGSALMPWAFTEEPLLKARMLSNSVNCPTDNSQEMINCLKMVPSSAILSKVEELFMPWLCNPFSPFGPVIENVTTNPFLDKHPYHLLKSGLIFHGSWLASITTEEGLYPGASFIDKKEYINSLNNNWHKIAPYLLDYNFTLSTERKTDVSNKIRHFYLSRQEISVETANNVIQMLGDRLFKTDMDLATKIQASVSIFPVYLLNFGYRGNVSLSDLTSTTKANFGVSHFDDIYYVLSPSYHKSLQSQSDRKMITIMSQIWASFIQNGLPNTNKTVCRWTPVSRDSLVSGNVNYLHINSHQESFMQSNNNFGNNQFWTSLGFNENVHYNINNL